jgi:PTS system mannose-specific IIB component/fructoselysine and glucoselysine-specific PTS system IIB component
MSIVLFRVDERLIHGQVVVGWGGPLRPDRYVVVDDSLAKSQWEQELYVLGVPDDVRVEFLTPEEARQEAHDWRESAVRIVILTRDLQTALELGRGGLLEGQRVNLGGLHSRRGRREVLPYLFLDEEEKDLLRSLAAEGMQVTAQDLPGSPKVGLDSLLS